MAGRLAGKVAVVTGAAPRGEGGGNGMATAIMFAREGAKVVLVNRSAERAEKLRESLSARARLVRFLSEILRDQFGRGSRRKHSKPFRWKKGRDARLESRAGL